MRLFTAISLPDDVREFLHAAGQALLRRAIEHEIRLTPPENLHLTLKFLGEVPDDQVPHIIERLSRTPVNPARVECDRFILFPPRGTVRVVAAGIAGESAEVAQLFQSIEDALEPLGFAQEGREFTPHITLGRNRPGRYSGVARALGLLPPAVTWPSPPFLADSFQLLKSDLYPTGPVYTPMATFSIS